MSKKATTARAWRQANPEKRRAYKRAYDEKNREQKRERDRMSYHRNKDRNREKRKLRTLATPPECTMIYKTRWRAKSRGIEHTITTADLLPLPEFCPVFGTRLEYKKGHGKPGPNAASVDRIDNSKGYVLGNVVIVSQRANVMKNDGTVEEHRRIADFYGSLL